MANDVTWDVEHIPGEDSVYMRAHRDFIRAGVLQPGVFRQHDHGMSVDWEKYSSASDTRQRAKNPPDNAVIELLVGRIRLINALDVKHNPEPTNRAHSNVVGLPSDGEDLTEARTLLLGLSTVILW